MGKTKKIIMPFWREFKGTQGEWQLTKEFNGSFSRQMEIKSPVASKHFTHCVLGSVYETNTEEGFKNAKLIEAAPKMHKLLNQFISQGILNKPDQEKVFEITAEAQQLLIDINGE